MAARNDKRTYPTVYGVWTNKGGVGKTTLTFHLACSYAKLNPTKEVVAIDMCPQSNLSATMLTHFKKNQALGVPMKVSGDKLVDAAHNSRDILDKYPQTVGGFFINYVNMKKDNIPAKAWLMDVSVNDSLPKNLHLFCGDSTLDLLAPKLAMLASGDVTRYSDPFLDVHVELRTFVRELEAHYADQGKELVVFIDTNPALSIYTQIALVAMTHLIIPVNADAFSMQAVKGMFHLLYALYPTTGPAEDYENLTFAAKARRHNLPLPQVTAIVNNRVPTVKEGDAEQDAHRPKAYRELAESHAGLLFDGYETAKKMDRDKGNQDNQELYRVFLPQPRGGGSAPQPFADGDIMGFSRAYTGTMRDMRTNGVAALSFGVPVYELIKKVPGIKRDNVKGLMEDMLKMMDAVFGKDMMEKADKGALALFRQLAGNQPADISDESDDSGNNGGLSSNDDNDGRTTASPRSASKSPARAPSSKNFKKPRMSKPKVLSPKPTKPVNPGT